MGTHWLRIFTVALGAVLPLTAAASPSPLARPLAAQTAAQGLVLSLALGEQAFSVAQPVEARFDLRNDRGTPVTLIISQSAFDLIVYSAKGEKTWAWTESRPFPLVPPERRVVVPGVGIDGTLVWDQTILAAPLRPAGKVAPGSYLVEGVLHAAVLGAPQLRLRTPRIAIVIRP